MGGSNASLYLPLGPIHSESGGIRDLEARFAKVSRHEARRLRKIHAAGLLTVCLLVIAACVARIRWPASRGNVANQIQLGEVKCHTAEEGEACHSDIKFVHDKFIKEHPEWYQGLTKDSSFKDIQAYLSNQKNSKGKPRCPWPCEYVPSTTAAPSESKGKCHTVHAGDSCYSQVENTAKLISLHPEWYGGLHSDSSLKAIQKYLHEQDSSVCPSPCGRAGAHDKALHDQKDCSTAIPGEACWDAVVWVKSTGFKKHPEWFKGIGHNSTPEEIQTYLSGRDGSHCTRPACHCHTAIEGEDCYTHVAFTIKAIPGHPGWYPGLTTNSTPKEVQAFLHEETTGTGDRVCPPPCGLDVDKEDHLKHQCHTAIAGEACYHQVLWAMDQVVVHPEWYLGLNSSSKFAEFQAWLHLGKKDSRGKRCPIPCDEEAMELARNYSRAGTCNTATKHQPCYATVLEVRKELLKNPDKYDDLTPASTFEDIQTHVFNMSGLHCDHLPCPCHTAVEGEKCYKDVSYVMTTALKLHMERYSMLSENSTREEVQYALHADPRHHCLLPCAPQWKDDSAGS